MKDTRFVSLLAVSALLAASLAGCGSSASSVASSASSEAVSSVAESAVSEAASESAAASSARALEDGTYTAEFDTDSSMFHVNEASDGKGTLTVEDGQMTLHISLQSKKIVNLYVGMAADAPDHEADWLQPTTDTVTYSDGTSEEVYGFDVPVEALDTDFQLAILGTKGKWYDHTVSVRGTGRGGCGDSRGRQLHLRGDAGGRLRPCHRGQPRCPDCGRRQNDRHHRLVQPQL